MDKSFYFPENNGILISAKQRTESINEVYDGGNKGF